MGRTEEALEVFDLLIETAEKIGRPRFAAPSINYSTLAFRDLYLVDEARRRNEQAIELVRREGQYGCGDAGRDRPDGRGSDAGRVRSHPAEWPRLWDEAINGATWRPWLGGCRLAFVRTELARQTEGIDETLAAATDALQRAQRAQRPKYEAAASEALGATLLKTGDATGGIARLEEAVRLADRLGTPTARWQYRGRSVVAGTPRATTPVLRRRSGKRRP
jgi:tetratricopeptide (TPR) repeat protein